MVIVIIVGRSYTLISSCCPHLTILILNVYLFHYAYLLCIEI